MLDLECVHRIVRILEGDGPIKERLFSAASRFWAALFEADDWPALFEARGEDLLARLLEDGSIRQTVDRMAETTARETAELLLQFVREFETFLP